jgi:hypothetical protein
LGLCTWILFRFIRELTVFDDNFDHASNGGIASLEVDPVNDARAALPNQFAD